MDTKYSPVIWNGTEQSYGKAMSLDKAKAMALQHPIIASLEDKERKEYKPSSPGNPVVYTAINWWSGRCFHGVDGGDLACAEVCETRNLPKVGWCTVGMHMSVNRDYPNPEAWTEWDYGSDHMTKDMTDDFGPTTPPETSQDAQEGD